MKKIALILGLVVAAISCNKAELNEENGVGVLNMKMSIEAQTKAALSSEDLLNTSSVKIYKDNYKGLVREYTYAQMPSPFYLAAGSYRVDVAAGEMVKENPALASWEQKSYKGSKDFTIRANNVTDVEVDALLARRIVAEEVDVDTRLAEATLAATRDELFTLRRSFSLPRAT